MEDFEFDPKALKRLKEIVKPQPMQDPPNLGKPMHSTSTPDTKKLNREWYTKQEVERLLAEAEEKQRVKILKDIKSKLSAWTLNEVRDYVDILLAKKRK